MGPAGPHQSTLSSLKILLNDKVLELGPTNQIPALTPKHVVASDSPGAKYFVAPPRTYGFVVFPQAGAKACL
jgi:hypothetical protein